jgi:dephospho-CoA kinase
VTGAAARRARRSPGRVIGLTGGLASGKSTVAGYFVELGARVVDADALAREVVEPGRVAYREIVRSFGREVLQADGRIDRQELGCRVFADPARRERLNAITHPRIRRAAGRAIDAHLRQGAAVVLYEAALLVETGYYRELDALIVVSLPLETQILRVMERDRVGRETAAQRVGSQLPLEAKLAVADFVIDSSGSLASTRQQVEHLWNALNAASRRGRGGGAPGRSAG